jgi:hypothetical protein
MPLLGQVWCNPRTYETEEEGWWVVHTETQSQKDRKKKPPLLHNFTYIYESFLDLLLCSREILLSLVLSSYHTVLIIIITLVWFITFYCYLEGQIPSHQPFSTIFLAILAHFLFPEKFFSQLVIFHKTSSGIYSFNWFANLKQIWYLHKIKFSHPRTLFLH